MISNKTMIAAATAIVATVSGLGVVFAFYEDYRPWPHREELEVVAARTYDTAITQQWNFKLILQTTLENCQRYDNCSTQRILELKQQINRINIELERLDEERRKYGGG